MTTAMTRDVKKNKKLNLPPRCFARGQRIWVRFKDETGAWVNKKTPYTIAQVPLAARYVATLEKGVEMKRTQGIRDALTVAQYLEQWLTDRENREIASAPDERRRMEKYVIPHIGKIPLEGVRMADIRDLVRKLRALKKTGEAGEILPLLAPRTVLHIYSTLHTAYESAIDDEHVQTNPVRVKRGELPKKLDADPEWRSQATYTVNEVEQLISDARIPAERRVLYALKALAGLRHGEAAALSWRHIDHHAKPLARMNVVQAWCSRTSRLKSTKSEITREVPVHPVLAKILATWKLSHWERVYGRAPKDDDFVIPTRTFSCVAAKDANVAFKRDLRLLELRVEAGKRRDRGGHDLRSFYDTRLIEDGADSLLVRRTTHAPPRDVNGGYERFSWAAICREIGKLKIEILDGKILELVTQSLHAEKKAGARWTSLVTPKGLEAASSVHQDAAGSRSTVEDSLRSASSVAPDRALDVTNVTSAHEALAAVERALRAGDRERALQLVQQMNGAPPAPDAARTRRRA